MSKWVSSPYIELCAFRFISSLSLRVTFLVEHCALPLCRPFVTKSILSCITELCLDVGCGGKVSQFICLCRCIWFLCSSFVRFHSLFLSLLNPPPSTTNAILVMWAPGISFFNSVLDFFHTFSTPQFGAVSHGGRHPKAGGRGAPSPHGLLANRLSLGLLDGNSARS